MESRLSPINTAAQLLRDVPAGQRPTISYLLEFMWLSTVRGGEVRQAQWKEFDEVKKVWVAPVERRGAP
jgi:hypothetical protein